jgi:hypothetical protein
MTGELTEEVRPASPANEPVANEPPGVRLARAAGELRASLEADADCWVAHPDYPFADWRYAVACEDTLLGYYEWCLVQAEQDHPDEEE